MFLYKLIYGRSQTVNDNIIVYIAIINIIYNIG